MSSNLYRLTAKIWTIRRRDRLLYHNVLTSKIRTHIDASRAMRAAIIIPLYAVIRLLYPTAIAIRLNRRCRRSQNRRYHLSQHRNHTAVRLVGRSARVALHVFLYSRLNRTIIQRTATRTVRRLIPTSRNVGRIIVTTCHSTARLQRALSVTPVHHYINNYRYLIKAPHKRRAYTAAALSRLRVVLRKIRQIIDDTRRLRVVPL